MRACRRLVGPQSEKKLQRLLSHEGTSFSAILDDVRRAMAVRLLSDTEAPISRIAGLLAYSTPGPFTLAFKRWTGVSPRVFRKRLPASSPCEGT
ncbi:MAG: helix-turn-helix transcriptional regulator [Hyphomicrobium zavarzinii]|uniref:helix-turn-helix transcriptional regulator n=1 Tax=Hyphomicrobium zavarzinii TaxID=48292 RepID=UPI001A567AD1|nr:helix-turn-helix transcriptional regulator [Hyphomicrobium zavarzinii]